MPHEILQYANYELFWNGQSLYQWVNKWKNSGKEFPVYVYSRKILAERFRAFQGAFPQAKIHFAMKSNHWSPLLKELQQMGSQVDVVSFGEAQAAMAAGFKPEQILFSGVGKTRKELQAAVQAGVYQINIEGEDEFQRLVDIKQNIRIGFRWTPGLDAQTHPFIKTGHEDTKFGMGEELLRSLVKESSKYPHLHLQGLSMHLGSQIQEMSDFEQGYQLFYDLIKSLDTPFINVDLGGGLGINYHSQNVQEDFERLESYKRVVDKIWGQEKYLLLFEPGRFISARAGGLITEVQALKKTPEKTIVVVDAGMHQLIRPVLYEAFHGIFPLKKRGESKVVDVVGPICESSDFLALDRPLEVPQVGDHLWIADTGAYGSSMSSRYNLRPEAEEVFIEEFS
ncbi:MAG: diaminopimelate decarboxylase [Bdellovibrionales bacterium]